jgi:hypothetical protein
MMIETLEPQVRSTAPEPVLEPFPGLRPFEESESGLFFGRNREVSQLRSIVLANSLVLLYAESGAGKSSLIRAGLVPALRKRRATVFPVLSIRTTGAEDFDTGIENPYVRGLAANWAVIADKETPLAGGRSHAERLADVTDFSDLVKLLDAEANSRADGPRVLIIDQFEELFTFQQEHWQARGDFFEQLERALVADSELSVLLAMREDYISQTDTYAGLVSNHLQQRFRIETLREPQALAAVKGPLAGTGRRFADGAAEYLVRQLMQIRIERNGVVERIPGEYVEPVQLQVVCHRLWADLPPELTEITEDDVRQSGDVDRALGRFYDDAVHAAAAQVRRTRERTIRQWITSDLITALGTRGTAHRDAALKKHVPRAALDVLVDEHLLRAEWRNGSEWYELTHDRLIAPIQSSNARFHEVAVRRRVRSLAAAAGLLLACGALLALALLTQPAATTRVTTRVVPGAAPTRPSATPSPPTVAVPANGGLYRRGGTFLALYACRGTSIWPVSGCTGSARLGAPIDTTRLGPQQFKVTATYGRAAIITTRNVTYTVVGFPTSAYTGRRFDISYPAGWHFTTIETPEPGNYTDTTIESPDNSNTRIRVDVSPRRVPDPRAAVLSLVKTVSTQAGYRLISFGPIRFNGLDALDWQFVLRKNRVLIREDDVFFNDPTRPGSFAVLTQAPVKQYPRLAQEFAQLRGTLAAH